MGADRLAEEEVVASGDLALVEEEVAEVEAAEGEEDSNTHGISVHPCINIIHSFIMLSTLFAI